MKSLINIIIIVCTSSLFTYCKFIDQNQINQSSQNTRFSWLKTDSTFALLDDNQVVWKLNFNKKQDKPYFHPIRINGNDLTLERPADHPWHRGLWFSWKFINKVNYWEEDPKKGYSEGRSKIISVEIAQGKDYSATVNFDLEYGPDESAKLLSEKRTISISQPDNEGNFIMDWTLHFTAKDSLLVFDRVAPLKHGGEVWGGYGGLGFRGAESLKNNIYTTSTGWTNNKSYIGEAVDANWMDMSAIIDNQSKLEAGITIFDHPNNPHHPTPWYVWYKSGEHSFFTPAILYNGILQLKPHKSMVIKYRIHVHADKLDIQKTNEMYKDYIKMKL
jgi:hypothetical protein